MTSIFLTGATGYIGGSVLTSLLQNKKYKVTALVRAQEKATLLQELGVTPLVGSLDDLELITNASAQADVVINTADCDHLASAQAIVAGLERKHKETSKKDIFI